MNTRDFLKLAVAVGASLLAGIIGSFFTAPSIPGWYTTIEKSMLTPPSWVFGPVWTLLYILMGIAAFLVWQKGLQSRVVRAALLVFFVQLVLNATWSIIFFGYQNPGLALVDIALLWLAIVCTMKRFYPVSKTAAYLLLPYLLWVSFATYLNFTIWTLN